MSKNSDGDKTAAVELSAEITLVVALLHIHYSIFFQKNHAKTFEKFRVSCYNNDIV